MTENSIRRIEELQQECEELRVRLKEAEAASEAKENFLSNMSHDIRTPMNAIVGMTALAKNHIDEKNRVMDALDKIEIASGHLLSLINDVLDMSRINSGRMRIQEELFQLSDLLHDVLVIVRPMSDARGHHFSFESGEIVRESLYGDALRLRQIYVNIISNAVKYTEEGGNIRVRVSEESLGERCALIFECEDNGIGMSEDFLRRIFDPFERVNSSTVSGIEGTGLGMSIVKKLIDAMEGTIEIESREGEGTKVRIRIPLRFEKLTVHTEELQGKRVVLIENDPGIISNYKQYLEGSGLQLEIVSTIAEAVSALTEADYHKETVDGVILGQELCADDDIFEAASYFRKSYPHLVMILAKECRFEEIEYRAERAGIDRYLPVPFFRKSLLGTLIDALSAASSVRDGNGGIPDLGGKHILLAEDNMINREIAKEILIATGAGIETAENGKEALQLFEASEPGHFAVILMDIQMPLMDGYTASREIRALSREDAKRIPIYAMTANAFAEDIEKARNAGMDGHLAKPIDMTALMQVLRRLS